MSSWSMQMLSLVIEIHIFSPLGQIFKENAWCLFDLKTDFSFTMINCNVVSNYRSVGPGSSEVGR
jgi:hypothetical protein